MEIKTKTVVIKIKGVKYYQGKKLFDSGLIKENQPVLLIPEPENPYDSNAVMIKTTSNEKLGHVSRHIAAKYQKLSKHDQIHSANIKCVTAASDYEVLDIRVSVTYSHNTKDIDIEIPKTPGVYEIRLGTSYRYIGSTKNLKKRFIQHRSNLISNIHHSQSMQNDFNRCGLDLFIFNILKQTDDQNSALELEAEIISEYYYSGMDLYNKTLDGMGIKNPKKPSKQSNTKLIDRENFLKNSKKNISKESITNRDSISNNKITPTCGKIKYFNGDVYKGELVDGQRHGSGILTFASGDAYEGEFVDDKPHGSGIYSFDNGSIYEGDFVDGQRHGSGILIYVTGDVYEGEFVNDQRQGSGIYQLANGDIYEGIFNDSQFLAGKYTTRLGNIYEGNFYNWVIYGEGKHMDPDGEIYQGEFKDWVLNGNGVHIDSEGNTFTGYFEEGFFRKGKQIDGTGNIFEGEFSDWTLCGEGKIIKEDGIIIKGEFMWGELHGYGKIISPLGDVIEGDFDAGRFRSNLAVFYAENGEEYIGLFKNGLISQFPKFVTQLEIFPIDNKYKLLSERFSGKGKLIFPEFVGDKDDGLYEGDILEGEFSKGKLIKGKHIFANGAISEGNFLDGELIKGSYDDGDGSIFEGNFKRMRLDGRGKITYDCGSTYEGVFTEGKLIKGKYNTGYTIYEGEFKDWRLHGKGVIKFADGDIFEGVFIDGESIKGAYIENYQTSLNGKKKKNGS